MRIFVSVVLLVFLFGFLNNQEFLNVTRCAYGSDDESISEEDIIIFTNELDNEQDEDASQNEAEGKEKSDGNSVSEKEITILFDELDKKPENDTPQKIVNINEKMITASLATALKHLENGEKHEARNILSELYFTEVDNERRNKIKKKLDILNAELIFSMAPSKDAVIYTVQSGDTLSGIASKFGVPYKSVMRINNKRRSTIRVGERLKVLNGEISLLVDKSDFTLTVLLDGHYIKQYPVGIGKYDKTPEETFAVASKLENPVWYAPDGVYEFGDPRNLLGTRWIGFADKGEYYGFGIHGTRDPDTIGKEQSNGCIRLRNEDVEVLYDFVGLNTVVTIQK